MIWQNNTSIKSPSSSTVLVSCCRNKTLIPLNIWVWPTKNIALMSPSLEPISREARHVHSLHGEGSPQTHAADHRLGTEHAGLLLTSDSI